MAEDPAQIAGGGLGGPGLPEVAQGAEAHHAVARGGQVPGDRLVQGRPAAVPGQEDHERAGPGRGGRKRHQGQVVHRLRSRGSPGTGRQAREDQRQEEPPHFATTPLAPRPMREAMPASTGAREMPPGKAMKRGSQSGPNFSLYCRTPWKL